MTRSEALKRAQAAYEKKRNKTPVGTRVDSDMLRKIDQARGNQTRSAWLLALIRSRLKD